MVESQRSLVGEKVRLTNRITATLKNYYSQVLEWFKDKDTQVFCEFVERYPTLNAAQYATPEELRSFFAFHHVVQQSAIARRLEQIQFGIPLTENMGIVSPMQSLVQAWIQQLKLLLKSLQIFEQQIEHLLAVILISPASPEPKVIVKIAIPSLTTKSSATISISPDFFCSRSSSQYRGTIIDC